MYTKLTTLFLLMYAAVAHASGEVRGKIELETKSRNDFGQTMTCHGKIDKSVNIKQVNLTEDDLAKGVTCFWGDFDGDGSSDWFLYGNKDRLGYHYLILFVDNDDRIKNVVPIHNSKFSYFWPYPKETRTVKVIDMEWGGPYLKVEGIFHPGERGKSNVFYFDKKANTFNLATPPGP